MNETIKEIKKYITELKIPGINQGIKTRIEDAYKLDQSYEDFLKEILMEAYDVRKENGRKTELGMLNSHIKNIYLI